MRRILFIHSSSELYGSDKSLLYLIKNLDRSKLELFVILPCEGPLVQELNSIPGVNVTVFEVAVLRRKNLSLTGLFSYGIESCKSYSYLKRYIKENMINIVYTNTAVVFLGAIAAKHSRIKNIWHIREIIKDSRERFIISSIVNHYADIIIANSKATGESICKNKDKLRIVYNAVEEKVLIDNVTRASDSIVVGMAGRINRWKGQKLFIDAAELVHQQYPDVKFKIAGAAYSGEEWMEKDLKDYINQKNMSDSFELLGLVSDMDSFYSTIDIFILPSIQPEPFGLVVIEAMEIGKPVIATNHGGPTEIIDNNINGYLVDYSTADEMALKCCDLIKDHNLRESIGRAGQEKKRTVFSLKHTVSTIELILNEI